MMISAAAKAESEPARLWPFQNVFRAASVANGLPSTDKRWGKGTINFPFGTICRQTLPRHDVGSSQLLDCGSVKDTAIA